jgi:FkbM family methyltransferase
MISISNYFLKNFPEGNIKNLLAAYYLNHLQKNGFSTIYEKGQLIVSYKGIEIKLCNYLGVSVFNLGYLKNYCIREGDVIVDAGAYTGAFTIYAAKIVGNRGRVLAFEPDSANFKILTDNISINELDNVTAINKGLWNKDDILKFNSKSDADSSLFYDDINGKNIIDLEVAALDSELERLGIKKINFVKMDIEGAEIEAIKGSLKTLKQNYVDLAIASYHIVNGSPTYIFLEKFFSEIGYYSETSFPFHLTTYGSKDANSFISTLSN